MSFRKQQFATETHPALQQLHLLMLGACFVLLTVTANASTYEDVLLYATVAVTGTLGLLFFWRRLERGFILLILAALLSPPLLQTYLGGRLNLAFMVALLLVLPCVTKALTAPVSGLGTPRSILIPLFLVMGASVASMGINRLVSTSGSVAPVRAQAAAVAIVLCSGLLLLASARILRDVTWLRRLVWLFLAAGCLRIALALRPAGSEYILPVGGIGQALPDSPLGSMFWTWFMALICGQLVLNWRLTPLSRVGLVLALAGAIYVTFISGRDWLSGWVPGFIACLVVIFMKRTRWILPALGVLVLAAILVQLPSASDFLSPDNAYSLSTRAEAATVLSKLAAQSPILGLGPANYYHLTQHHPIRGWYVKFSSHNNYIDLLLQFGIFCLAGFGWLLTAVFIMAARTRNRVSDPFERAYLYGATGGMAGTVVAAALGDWVIPFVYNVGVTGFQTSLLAWIWMGGVVALAMRSRSAWCNRGAYSVPEKKYARIL